MSFPRAECPIRITPKALAAIQSILRQKSIDTGLYGLRVGIRGGGCGGASPLLGFDTAQPTDERYELGDFAVFVEKKHLLYVIGLEIDHEENGETTGFVFNNPNG